MKFLSLILRIFLLVTCIILIFSGQSVLAHDDDEGELEEFDDSTTQDPLSDHPNGTVELY